MRNELPGWAKGVLALGATVVTVGTAYGINKYLQKDRTTEGDIKEEIKNGEQPSYSNTNYQTLADALYAARQGNHIFGTDEDTFYNVFNQMKNKLDVLKLSEAFGNRRLSVSLQDGNLGGFIADELNADEIDSINKILSNKSIDYRF